MKKLFTPALVLLMLISAFTGCAQSSARSGRYFCDTVTVSIGSFTSVQATHAIVTITYRDHGLPTVHIDPPAGLKAQNFTALKVLEVADTTEDGINFIVTMYGARNDSTSEMITMAVGTINGELVAVGTSDEFSIVVLKIKSELKL